ncbi:pyridoxine 5'-phosphate synthase [Amphiplicatus metriothermophilus]|uniref:Pyridoxine 5'-phosphate synthase n=1 Tax=Amphiplicatus metriothermophilus TaxID=1519374 RepID=A0A239PQ51_9PROT|nr:pyridoxine 5'-phosphate synthase [Amphiplicatus metriothermophilus]MBB5518773.1 pyridoxine 5-phosphate synthase [Amphiplicatus metriothermophilus]SNT72072.1 pyridoxine 5'-phosphate synthase [Amphiplicatus metriothermophilus]
MSSQSSKEGAKRPIRLGVNIDHVATIRNARGGPHPDPVRAAQLAADAGADGVTAHLREDRRHIRDDDMRRLKAEIDLPLNFEMAATAEMHKIVAEVRPHACCIVPENRNERTTEGGLDVHGQKTFIAPYVRELSDAGIRVSLFVDPQEKQIEAAREVGAPVVEIHTGAYYEACAATRPERIAHELELIRKAAAFAAGLGLEVHAGHGLTFHNVQPVAAIAEIMELNIGHFLIGESVFMGLGAAVKEMKRLMQDARTGGHY